MFLHNFLLTIIPWAKVSWHSNCHYKNFVVVSSVGIKRVDGTRTTTSEQIHLYTYEMYTSCAQPHQGLYFRLIYSSFKRFHKHTAMTLTRLRCQDWIEQSNFWVKFAWVPKLTCYNSTIKVLTALVGRLPLSVVWENGPERGLFDCFI